jgi:hypothetical protein
MTQAIGSEQSIDHPVEAPTLRHMKDVLGAYEPNETGEYTQDQRDDALDHMIGAVVAALGPDRAAAAFNGIAAVSNQADLDRARADLKRPDLIWQQFVSRDGGARSVIDAAAEHPLVGSRVFDALGRMQGDEQGQFIFASRAQLNGYLNSFGDPTRGGHGGQEIGSPPWDDVIAAEVAGYLDGPRIKGAWENSDNLGSDVRGVSGNQRAWEVAARQARRQQPNFDISLVGRSAEALKKHKIVALTRMGEIAIMRSGDRYAATLMGLVT